MLAIAGVVSAILTLMWLSYQQGDRGSTRAARGTSAAPLGILGDSDSHSYHDSILLTKPTVRGGSYRAKTYQWVEVLAHLRGDQLDPGPWGVWGTRRSIAEVRRWLGFEGRAPRKEDFRFNFAISGAGCHDLLHGAYRQVERLIQVMQENPKRWERGIVTLRIGVNDFGKRPALDAFAKQGHAAPEYADIQKCIREVGKSVALIRAANSKVGIVLVGILDNAHWAPYFDAWHSRRELEHISRALDTFDDALREIAARDPRIAFLDDRAWFAHYWGGRDNQGRPAYRSIRIGETEVVNSQGDEPRHAIVADGHAGAVWNALWARDFVTFVNEQFGLGVGPIEEAEIRQLLAI